MKVMILSGISGSGKTTFLRALEDTGYYCMDNFPLVLLQKFLELCELSGGKVTKCAFVVDIREREFFPEGKGILKSVKERYGAELLFLESSDDALIRRFRETRRSHPLYNTSNIKDALQEERALVGWIKEMSDRVIDTSQLTPHELRRFALKAFSRDEKRMKINLMSFGYSYGIPAEADMVLDVRFLPNPFFIEGLREKTGLSDEVRDYIRSHDVYSGYFRLIVDLLTYLIPLFEKEGKSYLTICFGCTGGKHRSVFIVKELEDQFSKMEYTVNISTIHRDINR
jgi:RNase adapter protein RapZ